jgi:acyl-CoA synthetase (AMP-forming)/AMP-acid ligase II
MGFTLWVVADFVAFFNPLKGPIGSLLRTPYVGLSDLRAVPNQGIVFRSAPMPLMPTPQRSRRRVLKPHQRRALVLLAGCSTAGCTKAVMLLHGFTADQLAELVRAGFIAPTIERAVGGAQTSEVASFKITEAGQRALGC